MTELKLFMVILPADTKEKYSISLSPAEHATNDALHVGYLKIEKLKPAGLTV